MGVSGGSCTAQPLPAASLAAVGRCSTSATLTVRPSAFDSRRASVTARSELPPSSKKLVSTLTASASRPSTAANTSRTAASAAVRGGTAVALELSASDGDGSCLRSILPLLVRGHARTPTTADGTMYAGSAPAAPASVASCPNCTAS
eukprot:7379541-Prymnesium_polylepis.1